MQAKGRWGEKWGREWGPWVGNSNFDGWKKKKKKKERTGPRDDKGDCRGEIRKPILGTMLA